MKEEDLIQIKKTIHFALRKSKFKNDTGFVFDRIAQVSLDNIEKQLNIHSVSTTLPTHVVKQLLHEAGNRASFMSEDYFSEWVESGW